MFELDYSLVVVRSIWAICHGLDCFPGTKLWWSGIYIPPLVILVYFIFPSHRTFLILFAKRKVFFFPVFKRHMGFCVSRTRNLVQTAYSSHRSWGLISQCVCKEQYCCPIKQWDKYQWDKYHPNTLRRRHSCGTRILEPPRSPRESKQILRTEGFWTEGCLFNAEKYLTGAYNKHILTRYKT